VRVAFVQHLSKATPAAAAAHVGQKIFMKYNIKYIKKFNLAQKTLSGGQ